MKTTKILLLAGTVLPAFALAAPAIAQAPVTAAPFVIAQAGGGDGPERGGGREERQQQRQQRQDAQQERQQRPAAQDDRKQERQKQRQEAQQERQQERKERKEAQPERQQPDRPQRQERPDAQDNRQKDRKDALEKRQDAQEQRQKERQDALEKRQEMQKDRQDTAKERLEQRQKAQEERQKDVKDAQEKREDAQKDRQDRLKDLREKREDRQEDRKDVKERREDAGERREDLKERREDAAERREDAQDRRQDSRQKDRMERLQKKIREERRDARDDKERLNERIDRIRGDRRERRDGDRVIITEGNRTIIREGNRTIIRRDEGARFRYGARDFREERGNGEIRRIVTRPDGSTIVTITDDDGRLIRRTRRFRDQEYVLIDNRPRGARTGIFLNLDLAPPPISIPRERYIVDADTASYDDIEEAFVAPPVARPERAYSLDEIRQNQPLRQYVRSVDLDAITFDTGSWEVKDDQIEKLEKVGDAMAQAIKKDPKTVFMVEGHTDAVGSDDDNLSLSDRRAESVAEVLTKYFDIPAENLTTQGYGEQYLKVQTDGAEARNRRVTIRNITSLLSSSN